MARQIMIPEELFVMIGQYFLVEPAADLELKIKKGLETKLDAIAKRELYTQYKTAKSAAASEVARKEYLNRVGVPDGFRW